MSPMQASILNLGLIRCKHSTMCVSHGPTDVYRPSRPFGGGKNHPLEAFRLVRQSQWTSKFAVSFERRQCRRKGGQVGPCRSTAAPCRTMTLAHRGQECRIPGCFDWVLVSTVVKEYRSTYIAGLHLGNVRTMRRLASVPLASTVPPRCQSLMKASSPLDSAERSVSSRTAAARAKSFRRRWHLAARIRNFPLAASSVARPSPAVQCAMAFS